MATAVILFPKTTKTNLKRVILIKTVFLKIKKKK